MRDESGRAESACSIRIRAGRGPKARTSLACSPGGLSGKLRVPRTVTWINGALAVALARAPQDWGIGRLGDRTSSAAQTAARPRQGASSQDLCATDRRDLRAAQAKRLIGCLRDPDDAARQGGVVLHRIPGVDRLNEGAQLQIEGLVGLDVRRHDVAAWTGQCGTRQPPPRRAERQRNRIAGPALARRPRRRPCARSRRPRSGSDRAQFP